MDTFLTANEVAQMLKLSLQTIRRYTMRKEIPFTKINRAVRYKLSDIELWVRQKEAAASKQNETNETGLFDEAESGAGV